MKVKKNSVKVIKPGCDNLVKSRQGFKNFPFGDFRKYRPGLTIQSSVETGLLTLSVSGRLCAGYCRQGFPVKGLLDRRYRSGDRKGVFKILWRAGVACNRCGCNVHTNHLVHCG